MRVESFSLPYRSSPRRVPLRAHCLECVLRDAFSILGFALFCVSGSCGLILIRELFSVLFSVGASRQRAIISLIAHMSVNPWIVGRAVIIRPACLATTLPPAHNAHR